jgi:hypothetical protein
MTAAAMMLSTAALAAQATSFAGKWTMVADPNAAAGGRGGRGGLGMSVSIDQDAKMLTMTRTTQAGDTKTMYMLDGSPSKNTMNFGGNSMEQTSTAKWDGAKLVIATTSQGQNGPTTTTMTLSLDASGNMLVAQTRPGRNGGDPTTTTSTYKKG